MFTFLKIVACVSDHRVGCDSKNAEYVPVEAASAIMAGGSSVLAPSDHWTSLLKLMRPRPLFGDPERFKRLLPGERGSAVSDTAAVVPVVEGVEEVLPLRALTS